MPVQDPPFSGAIVTTTTFQTLYDQPTFGVHEGYIVLEGIQAGDVFEIEIQTYNVYRASLYPLRVFTVSYEQLDNGDVPQIHFMPRQTTHFRLRIKRNSGSDRTISYTFMLITPD